MLTAASGTNTPSSMTSWEPVPRMPSVRQVSWTLTPGAFSGIAKCSTVGPPSGSSKTAIGHEQVAGRRAAGEDLAAVTR